MKKVFIYLFPFLLCSCVSSLPEKSINELEFIEGDFVLMTQPDKRLLNQNTSFSDEYSHISFRRNYYFSEEKNEHPKNIVGLGLSGGGIRSAAFQFGLLSGLHQTKYKNKTLLKRIDYLSGVSGGNWSSGAYWISETKDDEFFNCLDVSAAKQNSDQCINMLRANQKPTFFSTKENWERDIRETYLPEKCKFYSFDKPNPECQNNSKLKPYPIFNITHSTIFNPTHKKNNLPFQITPHTFGTIVDCNSQGNKDDICGSLSKNSAKGFFVRQQTKNFKWQRRKKELLGIFGEERLPGAQLSKVLAHSSAVVPSAKGTAFSMEAVFFDQKQNQQYAIKEIRPNYILSDGGFTENLGLLALIERGVEYIVLSDMGDINPPLLPPEDLKVAMNMTKKFFIANFLKSKVIKKI